MPAADAPRPSFRRAVLPVWLVTAARDAECATMYGPAIWLVMSLAVIPLATGAPPRLGARWRVQVAAHVPFVAIPLVFTARRVLGLARRDGAARGG